MFALGQFAFRKGWSTQRELSNEPKQSPLSRVQNRIRFFDPMVRGYQLSEASGGGGPKREWSLWSVACLLLEWRRTPCQMKRLHREKKTLFWDTIWQHHPLTSYLSAIDWSGLLQMPTLISTPIVTSKGTAMVNSPDLIPCIWVWDPMGSYIDEHQFLIERSLGITDW